MNDVKKPEIQKKNDDEEVQKKSEPQDQNKKNENRPESRMMNFFNQEFIERKIDFKPKKILSDQRILKDDIKKVLKTVKIYDKLLEVEKNIDEKMFKTRLEVQENLIMPSPKVKALLRIHLFGFFKQDENTLEDFWTLRIQGRVLQLLDNQEGGFYRKFSFFFQKIVIKFDSDQENTYPDVEWNRQQGAHDIDGFEVKKVGNRDIKMKIVFFLNTYSQEVKLSDELSALIGIKQDTRPRIIHALWQYIKLNRLQDSENSRLIINNKELKEVFGVDKMDITSIPIKINDHLKNLDPIEIEYTINPLDKDSEPSIHDLIVTIDDPHYLDISNFLSSIENESILFPKSLFYNKSEAQTQSRNERSQTSFADKFYTKIGEYDRNINDLIEKLKKHKYKYDFYDAYSKDPVKFINNFFVQQNYLLKIMKEESSIIDSRWDYQSSQYYKDYEDILKDYTEIYLNKNIQK